MDENFKNGMKAGISLKNTLAILDGGGDSMTDYSTEEQVIGKWIDGKPLYQKTYLIEPTVDWNPSDYINILTIPTEFNIVYSIMGFSSKTGQDYYPIPTKRSSWDTMYNIQNGVVRISVGGTSWGKSYNAILTIRYTKTTD